MPGDYLRNYAERESAMAGTLLTGHKRWRHVLTLPAFDEAPDFLTRLAQRSEDALIILVVNQSTAPITPANRYLMAALQQQHPATKHLEHLSLHRLGALSLLLVDRANTPLPPKTGVGLARKIAADIALQLIHQGQVASQWIYCTDADATLPERYFTLAEDNPAVAASLPFQHSGPPGRLLDATRLYEHAIRYYAQGLAFTGSTYGFLSLGSSLAVKARPYAQVRGFNLRPAGEDFYLLNKLAKIGRIDATITQNDNCISLAARLSNRTPFGTGAAVGQICQLPSLNDYLYYAPECFHTFKHWFDTVPHLTQRNFQAAAKQLPDALQAALHAQKFQSLADHVRRQGKSPHLITEMCRTWLDGFRSLKIIRHLQAQAYPPAPLLASLARQPFGCQSIYSICKETQK